MKIEVGDRVTYDDGYIELIFDSEEIKYKTVVRDREIIKVERIGQNGWEVVEEKKELLTEKEREFLKFFVKHYDVSGFSFLNFDISVYDLEDNTVSYINYPENMEFEGVKRCTRYTSKELRIGGINK